MINKSVTVNMDELVSYINSLKSEILTLKLELDQSRQLAQRSQDEVEQMLNDLAKEHGDSLEERKNQYFVQSGTDNL